MKRTDKFSHEYFTVFLKMVVFCAHLFCLFSFFFPVSTIAIHFIKQHVLNAFNLTIVTKISVF